MRLFPLFADLKGRRVLVVGGGPVAERKTKSLLASGALVTIGAPQATELLEQLHAQGRIERLRDNFPPDWLAEVWLVVAAPDDRGLNRQIRSEEHTPALQSLMRL